MRRAVLAVGVWVGACLIAGIAMADRTSVVYAPLDGGSAQVPNLTGRIALEMHNNYSVAVCVVAGTTAPPSVPCRPVLPGGSMVIDAVDSDRYSFRLCSGATVVSCMGDGGVTVTEVQ